MTPKTQQEHEEAFRALVDAQGLSLPVVIGDADEAADKSGQVTVRIEDSTLMVANVCDVYEMSVLVALRVHHADHTPAELNETRRKIQHALADPQAVESLGLYHCRLASFGSSIEGDYWRTDWRMTAVGLVG